MHHGPELATVVILCVALSVGALMRGISRRTGFPYTVAMMLVGVAAGIGLKVAQVEGPMVSLLSEGRAISSDLIVFVFLPALVFESAFALDVHAFRKNLGFVVVLAVPALLISTVATAACMVGLTSSGLGLGGWSWGWSAALVFGALISATDPVAVVSILRELGAPKRVGLLIEGESLLNDGTAIVVFGVLLSVLAGGDFDAGASLLELGRVAGGGIAVGLALGVITGAWLGRIYDDAPVEITLTVVLAYAAMILAESVLHVSGVLAIVTAGVYLAGYGRTRITPSVAHFLHRFWQMVAYVANTVIFLLVGFLIAAHLHEAPPVTVGITVLGFLSIVAIRFLVTFAMRPLSSVVGDPVDPATASVISWGGLRGAVSLALALVVMQHPAVPEPLRVQILTVTAGIVMLTIVVNGTSIGWLLRRLGLTRVGPAESLQLARADERVLAEVTKRVNDAQEEPSLRTIPWGEVHADLRQRRERVAARLDTAVADFESAEPIARAAAVWRFALLMERRVYRRAYAAGTLSPGALEALDHDIDTHLDHVEAHELRPPPSRLTEPRWTRIIDQLTRRLRLGFGRFGFRRLFLQYDLARAVAEAARHVRAELEDQRLDNPETVDEVLSVFLRYQREAKQKLEELRTHLPEVCLGIEQRLAAQVALNFEAAAVKSLEQDGTIGEVAAARAAAALTARNKRLFFQSTDPTLAETAALCRETPLFADLDEEVIDELAVMTIEQVLATGEWLFREGEKGDSMYIVARGAVEVVQERDDEEVVLAVLGGGDLLGEMAMMTGDPRTAGARAATPLTVGRISKASFKRLFASRPELVEKFWDALGRRFLDNRLRHGLLGEMPSRTRRSVVERAMGQGFIRGASFSAGPSGAFVVAGSLQTERGVVSKGEFMGELAIGLCISEVRVLDLPPQGVLSIIPPAAP